MERKLFYYIACIHLLSFTSTEAQVSSADVRLVGGNLASGRVEIRRAGKWGTICDDDWDLDNARVVCRMLGFVDAIAAHKSAHFGEGTGAIHLDNVGCSGNERSISDCNHRGWGVHNCDHDEDASVVCQVRVLRQDIRLVGGDLASGRVEIRVAGKWGTVCDDFWSLNDARVVCRMLGFAGATSAHPAARFGRGTGSIYLDNVGCTGSERSIADCSHRGWGVHNCGHSEDASVTCQLQVRREDVRLVGGDLVSGRVEIRVAGTWGTVCDDSWGLSDARVICRMLGFGSAIAAHSSAHFGRGSGNIHLDNVVCLGFERSISDCTHRGWGVHNCGHGEDASVVCKPQVLRQDIRLVGGSTTSGRVEIRVAGKWGTICDDDWDLKDARVVCRMLGYVGATAAYKSARYGRGTGSIYLDNVACTGNERSIADCKHRGWGVHNCGHSEDASVACTSTRIILSISFFGK